MHESMVTVRRHGATLPACERRGFGQIACVQVLEPRRLLSAAAGAVAGRVLDIPSERSPPIEAPLGGWKVYLDTNGNGRPDRREPQTLTDSSGRYVLTGVRPGRYRVAVVYPPGWAVTPKLGGPNLVSVRAGQTAQPINFAVTLVLSGVTASIPIQRPVSVAAGRTAHVFLQLENEPDGVPLNGKFDITLTASPISPAPTTMILVSTTRRIRLAAGRSRKAPLAFRVPREFLPGDYSVSATVLPHGAVGIAPVVTSASQPIHVTAA